MWERWGLGLYAVGLLWEIAMRVVEGDFVGMEAPCDGFAVVH